MRSISIPEELSGKTLAPSRGPYQAYGCPVLTVDSFLAIVSGLDSGLVRGWGYRRDGIALLLNSEAVKEILFVPGDEVTVSMVDRGDSYIDANRYWTGEELVGWVWAWFMEAHNLSHLAPADLESRLRQLLA